MAPFHRRGPEKQNNKPGSSVGCVLRVQVNRGVQEARRPCGYLRSKATCLNLDGTEMQSLLGAVLRSVPRAGSTWTAQPLP